MNDDGNFRMRRSISKEKREQQNYRRKKENEARILEELEEDKPKKKVMEAVWLY